MPPGAAEDRVARQARVQLRHGAHRVRNIQHVAAPRRADLHLPAGRALLRGVLGRVPWRDAGGHFRDGHGETA
ncbi:hypothetical protein [Yangia pacifica]|uniref:hypothetical protein n=1 Tax=Alloyangia pacifica TaxID=311180 RepID=UPI001CD1E26F|nr:hypothetical protein [Alloyangia pacifica]